MSRIKSRLSAYRDYLRPLVMEGKPMSSEDVLVMIQQLQDDLKKDERPKLTKIEKCFVESLNDKWDYLCRNSKFLIFLIIRNIICSISSIREIIQYYFVD